MKALLITPEVPQQPIREIEADSIIGLLKQADIPWGWGERVHGKNSRVNDFVLVGDEEAIIKGLKVNLAAIFISGYPGKLYGNFIMLSEQIVGIDGMDFVSLNPTAVGWLINYHPAFAELNQL
jgi:hypothetical protein